MLEPSFPHQVSLVGRPHPLDSLTTSPATLLIWLTIYFHIFSTSSSRSHFPSLIILFVNTSCFSPFKPHHLILGFLSLISLLFHLLMQISCTTNRCWVITLSPNITLPSLQNLLSTFRIIMISIGLVFVPLLKVIKCNSLF